MNRSIVFFLVFGLGLFFLIPGLFMMRYNIRDTLYTLDVGVILVVLSFGAIGMRSGKNENEWLSSRLTPFLKFSIPSGVGIALALMILFVRDSLQKEQLLGFYTFAILFFLAISFPLLLLSEVSYNQQWVTVSNYFRTQTVPIRDVVSVERFLIHFTRVKYSVQGKIKSFYFSPRFTESIESTFFARENESVIRFRNFVLGGGDVSK